MGNEPIKRGVLNFMDISILKPWNSEPSEASSPKVNPETLESMSFLTTEAQRNTERDRLGEGAIGRGGDRERERSGEGAIGRGKEGETKRPNNGTIEVPNP